MAFFVKAAVSPITDFTAPLYHLVRGDPDKKKQLEKLLLTTFRATTVVGFLFAMVAFENGALGNRTHFVSSLEDSLLLVIHPYAAVQSLAWTGVIFTVFQTAAHAFKSQSISSKEAMYLITTAQLLCLGQVLKDHVLENHWLDKQYQDWSQRLSQYCYGQN